MIQLIAGAVFKDYKLGTPKQFVQNSEIEIIGLCN